MSALHDPSEAAHASATDAPTSCAHARGAAVTRARAIDRAPDGSIVTDARGVVRHVTDAVARHLNVAARVLVGKPLVHFVARQDCAALRAIVGEARASGACASRAIRFRPRRGAGAPFTWIVSARAERDEAGRTSLRWTTRAATDDDARTD